MCNKHIWIIYRVDDMFTWYGIFRAANVHGSIYVCMSATTVFEIQYLFMIFTGTYTVGKTEIY